MLFALTKAPLFRCAPSLVGYARYAIDGHIGALFRKKFGGGGNPAPQSVATITPFPGSEKFLPGSHAKTHARTPGNAPGYGPGLCSRPCLHSCVLLAHYVYISIQKTIV